jgi:hydroxyacylglutathione hydrolase
MTAVIPLKALSTNLVYLHRCGNGRAFVVDPSDAGVVFHALQQHDLTLTAILVTHHHWDHVAGAEDLQRKNGCELIGIGRTLVPAPDRVATDGDVLKLGEVAVRVMATPGHTPSSVCYYIAGDGANTGLVYTGDTLFVGGCGRLLEGDASTMWQSLQKLAALPADTLVHCGHDYALENYEFAVTIDPANRRLRERLAEVQKALEYSQLTVPSTIAQERATNIFLQAERPQIATALGMVGAPPEEVFAELRRRKDEFGG